MAFNKKWKFQNTQSKTLQASSPKQKKDKLLINSVDNVEDIPDSSKVDSPLVFNMSSYFNSNLSKTNNVEDILISSLQRELNDCQDLYTIEIAKEMKYPRNSTTTCFKTVSNKKRKIEATETKNDEPERRDSSDVKLNFIFQDLIKIIFDNKIDQIEMDSFLKSFVKVEPVDDQENTIIEIKFPTYTKYKWSIDFEAYYNIPEEDIRLWQSLKNSSTTTTMATIDKLITENNICQDISQHSPTVNSPMHLINTYEIKNELRKRSPIIHCSEEMPIELNQKTITKRPKQNKSQENDKQIKRRSKEGSKLISYTELPESALQKAYVQKQKNRAYMQEYRKRKKEAMENENTSKVKKVKASFLAPTTGPAFINIFNNETNHSQTGQVTEPFMEEKNEPELSTDISGVPLLKERSNYEINTTSMPDADSTYMYNASVQNKSDHYEFDNKISSHEIPELLEKGNITIEPENMLSNNENSKTINFHFNTQSELISKSAQNIDKKINNESTKDAMSNVIKEINLNYAMKKQEHTTLIREIKENKETCLIKENNDLKMTPLEREAHDENLEFDFYWNSEDENQSIFLD